MGKSISAKVMSNLLKLWPKLSAEECEKKIGETLKEGEKPTPAPKNITMRHEDNENGRIFYANEESNSRYVIFYLHGGAYRMDFVLPHWLLIEKLIKETDAAVIAPAYRLVPFGTYKEAFDLIVPVYREYCESHPDKKVILMGDSAGGGLALALAEYFKTEGLRLPDELVLLSPWIDVIMDNEEIEEYQKRDPFLAVESLRIAAKHWAGDLDVRDYRISPIFGDFK